MTTALRYRRLALTLPATLLMMPLAACDWVSGSSSTTKMQNVEIQPGTASDEMITLDQASGDATAVDPSTAVGPPTAGSDNGDAPRTPRHSDTVTDTQSDDAASSPTSSGTDQVITPPAGGAEPSRPAATAASSAATRPSGTR